MSVVFDYEDYHTWLCLQMCCYNEFGSLISEEDGSGGSFVLFHPRHYPKLYNAADADPKAWCCDYSDKCDTFYSVRPLDKCDAYGAPLLGGSMYMLITTQNKPRYPCVKYITKLWDLLEASGVSKAAV